MHSLSCLFISSKKILFNSETVLKHGAVRSKRSGSFWLLQALPTVLIHTCSNITRKKLCCINTYLCFLCQGDQNGNSTVTNQLRLSEIPPAEKTEQLSRLKGRDRWETNRLSVSVAPQSVTCSLCVCLCRYVCPAHGHNPCIIM